MKIESRVDGHLGVDAQWLASQEGLVGEDCTAALIPGESGHLFLQLSPSGHARFFLRGRQHEHAHNDGIWGDSAGGPLMNGYVFADASYQSTTEITGGTLMDTMKSVPFFGRSMKNAFAPTTTLTMVHGNQKAVVTKIRPTSSILRRRPLPRLRRDRRRVRC